MNYSKYRFLLPFRVSRSGFAGLRKSYPNRLVLRLIVTITSKKMTRSGCRIQGLVVVFRGCSGTTCKLAIGVCDLFNKRGSTSIGTPKTSCYSPALWKNPLLPKTLTMIVKASTTCDRGGADAFSTSAPKPLDAYRTCKGTHQGTVLQALEESNEPVEEPYEAQSTTNSSFE